PRSRCHATCVSSLGQEQAVALERCPLRWRRIAAGRAEVDEAEEPLSVRQPDRLTPGLRAEHMRCPPVTGEPARMRCEENGVDGARGRADVLFVLLEVSTERSGGDHERRRTLELRCFGGTGRLFQLLHGLGAENAKAPRVRPVMV